MLVRVLHVFHSAHLADAVHTQLGDADVYGPHAEVGRESGPDGRTAAKVALDDEVLHGHASEPPTLSEQGSCEAVGRVALINVVLNDDALAEEDLVSGAVLVHVIRVQRVGHVGGDEVGRPAGAGEDLGWLVRRDEGGPEEV